MSEEKEVKEPEGEPEEPVPEVPDMVKRAEAAAERLEKAHERLEKITRRQEAMRVEATLGGKAAASIEQKEESPEEYKDKVMRGDV